MKLYESLAQQYIDDIQSGYLPSGTRLPSLRVLTKQHAVSMTTAIRSYNYLEAAGWIFSQPQSGFFVSKQINETNLPLVPKFKGENRDPKEFSPNAGYNSASSFFCPLGTAMIAPSLQPKIALQRTIKRCASRMGDDMFFYPAIQGEVSLRRALSDHFRQDHFSFHYSEVVITNGCIDAIRIALESTTKEGDTVAISSPCFSGLLDLLAGLSRNIIEISCDDGGLDLEQLEGYMKNKKIAAALFNTSHMNPSGTSLSVEQKQRLAQLAEQYCIPIIEDDIYFELAHNSKPPLPVKHWDKSGYIIWCGSFSKVLAEGLRIGWCLPGRYLDAYLKRQQLTSLGVNHLMQVSMAEFINTGDYRAHINKMRLTLSYQVHAYRQLFITYLPANARISMPDGGLVLWIQIPSLNACLLEKEARKQQIDIRVGACFSTHQYYLDCFRINCGWPLEHSLKQEIEKTEKKVSPTEKIMALCVLINKIILAGI